MRRTRSLSPPARPAAGPTLLWPDYAGNALFNTLGNLALDPSAGLLFPDFARRRTLQMTGRAHVLWDEAARAPFVGAERVVSFAVDEVIEADGAPLPRLSLTEYSPFNPTPEGQ